MSQNKSFNRESESCKNQKMNLLLIHVHEFFPFSCVAALHFPVLSCTSPLSSLYRNFTSCLSMVQFQIRQFFFRHQGRGTMAMHVHGQRQLTNHITCSSDSLVNALFSNTHTHTPRDGLVSMLSLTLQFQL